MKTIIAGSRRICNRRLVEGLLDQSKLEITGVISGMALGVDSLGKEWAEKKGIPVLPFPVTKDEWNIYGKSAGMRRNKRMAEIGEALIIVWDGKSSGSRNMKELMAGGPIEEHVIAIPPVILTPKENNLHFFVSGCCRKPLESWFAPNLGDYVLRCSICFRAVDLEKNRNLLWIGE